jgi:hypothetical protein
MALEFGNQLFKKNESQIVGDTGNIMHIGTTGKIEVAAHDVNISGTPAVTVTSGTVSVSSGSVSISNSPAVTVTSGSVAVTGNVGITGTPNVAITSGNVGITGTPAVTVTSGSVAVTGNVGITGTPNVSVTGNVGITGNPTVDIHGQTVDVTGQTVYAVGTGSYVITGEVTFPSAQEVNISSQTGDLNVSVVNASIPITVADTLDVNITNADLTISASGTIDVDIQNASVDVFMTSDDIEQHKVTVTNSSTTQSWTNPIKAFLFFNDGPATMHINFGTTATTDHLKIAKGTSFSIDFASQDTRFITSAGTAAVYCVGLY